MAALTKTQLDHAKTRIAAAMAAYTHRHIAVLGEEPNVQEYDDEQKITMIRIGVAVLKPKYRDDPYGHLTSFFTYPDTPEMVAARAAGEIWVEAQNKVHADANAIEQMLLDELVMSPNGAAALARIAEAFAG